MIFQLSIVQLKAHYSASFVAHDAISSVDNFKNFLKELVTELSVGLSIDVSLLNNDFSDPTLCSTRSFGALECLKRILLPVAEAANYKATNHPDWSLLAGRLEIQRLKLTVPETLLEMINKNPGVWRNDREHTGVEALDYYSFASKHAVELEEIIKPERDYDLYFFGVRTLEKSYLMRLTTGGDQLLETPQRMYLRIAAFLWMPDITAIKNYYDLMSTGAFTHASPTMFHSGIAKGSLASCFLLSMQDDLTKIFNCLGQCATISKSAGGIGLDITNIRHSKVSHMGNSSGIVPMLQVYNAAMRYVDQCFHPDTIVYTKEGPKKIMNVTPGDELITLHGFGKVGKPMHYKYDSTKNVVSLRINHYFKAVTVAGVHPLFAVKGSGNIVKKIASGAVVPEFISVNDLDVGDAVLLPIPQYTLDNTLYTVDDCYMYGILVANCYPYKGKNSFKLTFVQNNKSIEWVKNYLNDRFIQFTIRNRNTIMELVWSGGANFPFTRKMLYDKNTRIIHHSMIHLPVDKTMTIIKGMLCTDTDFINGNSNMNPNAYLSEILYYNSSSMLLESLRYMLLRMGIATRGNDYYISIPRVPELTVYLEDIPNHFVLPDYTVWNGFLISTITEKHAVEYTHDTIIELEMELGDEEHANYCTAIGIAHNGGRRKGSATIFLQPWHIDFPDFILLKRQHGKEERRARDLFYSVWNCDIFMERVRDDKEWTLFCPKFVPMLKNTFGDEFDKWYTYYEVELAKQPNCDNFMKKMPARQLWNELLTTQVEAGMPFMTNKDTANNTSNQKNLGVIRSSNLCVEIVEVTDENTISSCNLASIALDEATFSRVDGNSNCTDKLFVYKDMVYDLGKLGETVRLVVRGLNRVIDRTYYPLSNENEPGPIKSTNCKYRPLGLGVQGLADTFLKMGLAWTDPEARELNKEIFATIYYYAVLESVELAKKDGVYTGFYGSPASEGLLKPDLMALERARKQLRAAGVSTSQGDYAELLSKRSKEILNNSLSKRYNWDDLRKLVKENGMRNSLLVALMPTASSAQIRYKNESFEPFTTNMYVRSVLSGNHLIVNRYMVEDLTRLGIWNKSVVNFIIKNEGSIADLPLSLVSKELQPQLLRVKEKCKTAFELSQKLLVDMSIDRACYVCQSQSLNIHIKDPSFKQMTSLHFYGWENGLTTGMYYLRTAPATEAIKFTVEGELDVKKTMICTDDVCVMCQA